MRGLGVKILFILIRFCLHMYYVMGSGSRFGLGGLFGCQELGGVKGAFIQFGLMLLSSMEGWFGLMDWTTPAKICFSGADLVCVDIQKYSAN